MVAARITPQTQTPLVPADPRPSRTAREMMDLARSAFGPKHWTTAPQTMTYYDPERGYWLFFQKYDRTKDGARMEFAPFAAIWRCAARRT